MDNWIPFNINHYVWVKLTDAGLKHLEKEHYKYASDNYPFEQWLESYSKDGWTKFQMHSLIESFGNITVGDLMFETNIRIEYTPTT